MGVEGWRRRALDRRESASVMTEAMDKLKGL
jgi:hypothetical protein